MAKDKFMEGRNEGMLFALRIAEEKGIEGLKDEIRFRHLTSLPTAVPRKALNECVENIKMNVVDTFTLLTVATLHDEFGFGQKRCQQFIKRFEEKTDCLVDDYCSWEDYIRAIKEELNLTLDIRKNDKNVKI